MDYDFLRYAVDQGVATITLCRPDVLNSFNRRMAQELQQALTNAGRDESVRAVLNYLELEKNLLRSSTLAVAQLATGQIRMQIEAARSPSQAKPTALSR